MIGPGLLEGLLGLPPFGSFGSAAGAGGAAEYYERVLATQSANLIAYWRLNETSGTVADNAEGTAARDGAYAGPTLNDSIFTNGDPVPFHGGTTLTARINIASASLQSAFNAAEGTLMAWFKVASAAVWTDSAWRHVVRLYVDGNNYVDLIKTSSANQFALWYAAGGTLKARTIAISDTGWNQVVITWSVSNDRVRAYLNGAQQGVDLTALGTWVGTLSSNSMNIGSGFTTGEPWHGWTSHVALWTTELTASEVAALSPFDCDWRDLCGVETVNAATPLTTPTSDGSGQSVHPTVYDAGAGNTWNGYRYWMAMTPFPNGDASFEYVEILVSNDGDTWIDPGTNPVAGDAGGSNADPDFTLSADGNTLWCVYIKDGATSFMRIVSSTDGVNWSADTELFTSTSRALLSPAIIYKSDLAKYVLWYVDASTLNDKKIYRRTSDAPDSGWSAAEECVISGLPVGKDIWHMDINYDEVTGEYHLLAQVGDGGSHGAHSSLYFGSSTDGVNWAIATDKPLLTPANDPAWDGGRIYRSCWTRTASGYDLWYSADDVGEVGVGDSIWHIARTPVTGI